MTPDIDQKIQAKAERLARYMIYPGGKLYMDYYVDNELGPIYVAIGLGEVVTDQFYRELCLGELAPGEVHRFTSVWRGLWFDRTGFGEKITLIDGREPAAVAISLAVEQGLRTLRSKADS